MTGLEIGMLGINPDAFGVWLPDDPNNTSWEAFLDAASDIGYEAVELGPNGYMPRDPNRLASELGERSLTLTCGYLPVAFHDPASRDGMLEQLGKTADATAGAGAEYVLALARPELNAGQRVAPNNNRLQEVADGLVALSRAAADRHGLHLVFHPHVGMAIESADETERLLDATDGQVSLCLDVGQFAFAGGDPAAFLRSHGDHVSYLHLRDVDAAVRDRCVAEEADFEAAARLDVFCEPGSGSVDFEAVAAAAAEIGFDGPVIVERSYLDRTPEEARAAAERSFDAYRRFGFGQASPERVGP